MSALNSFIANMEPEEGEDGQYLIPEFTNLNGMEFLPFPTEERPKKKRRAADLIEDDDVAFEPDVMPGVAERNSLGIHYKFYSPVLQTIRKKIKNGEHIDFNAYFPGLNIEPDYVLKFAHVHSARGMNGTISLIMEKAWMRLLDRTYYEHYGNHEQRFFHAMDWYGFDPADPFAGGANRIVVYYPVMGVAPDGSFGPHATLLTFTRPRYAADGSIIPKTGKLRIYDSSGYLRLRDDGLGAYLDMTLDKDKLEYRFTEAPIQKRPRTSSKYRERIAEEGDDLASNYFIKAFAQFLDFRLNYYHTINRQQFVQYLMNIRSIYYAIGGVHSLEEDMPVHYQVQAYFKGDCIYFASWNAFWLWANPYRDTPPPIPYRHVIAFGCFMAESLRTGGFKITDDLWPHLIGAGRNKRNKRRKKKKINL